MKKWSINHSSQLLEWSRQNGPIPAVNRMSEFIAELWLALTSVCYRHTDNTMKDKILSGIISNLRNCHRIAIGLSLHTRRHEKDDWILVEIHGYAKGFKKHVYHTQCLFNIKTGAIGV